MDQPLLTEKNGELGKDKKVSLFLQLKYTYSFFKSTNEVVRIKGDW